MEIENGKIESTNLGPEDHGILTFWLSLAFDGGGQGFGGYDIYRSLLYLQCSADQI